VRRATARRRATTLSVAALASAAVLAYAGIALTHSDASPRAGLRASVSAPAPAPKPKPHAAHAAGSAKSAGTSTLTAAERRSCPRAAAACVDLAAHLTWLQSGGQVTFGPVRMEPGPPGSAHATPRGTFHVAWKAGPGYISNEYNEAMPWATFFATGGIAFHGGSLTKPSHGCVHLTVANAHYYHDHLPIAAEVVVF
jgi:hypothetical protein